MLFKIFFPHRFNSAKNKIKSKYDEIEISLIEEFARAQRSGDISRMKEIAKVLSQFKGYSQCIDAYIEQSQEVRPLTLFIKYDF